MVEGKEQVLNQLSEPQQVVVTILEDNWSEVSGACQYNNRDGFCPLNGEECSFRNCKLLGSSEKGKSKVQDKGGVKNGRPRRDR